MKLVLTLSFLLFSSTTLATFSYWNFGKDAGSEYYWEYGQGLGSLYFWSTQQSPGSSYYWKYGTASGSKNFWENSRLVGSRYYWENGVGPGSRYYWENGQGKGSKYYWLSYTDSSDLGVLMISMCKGGVIRIEPCRFLTKSPLNNPRVLKNELQCEDEYHKHDP